jgi:phenylalanyl-tRNA synthetase beta chain
VGVSVKVSYQWLSEYVDLEGITAAELAERLTRAGIEVDAVESRNKGVSRVVVGYVIDRQKHPDADKLSVCRVDAGTGEELQIVCGAPNVAAGQKVPVALVGAELPGGVKIKKAKLRGVESQGMICSAKELGMNDKLLPKEIQEGILVLPDDARIGDSILDVLGLNDEVLELDLTPNRADCLSMLGVAYEVAAILGRDVRLPDEIVPEQPDLPVDRHIRVAISNPEACAHYAARYIADVRLGPSPLWMQNRLMAAGIRPINNVVDITNYVMLEYGQPLHAFDADTLHEGHIDVRLAREGEKLTTLDGAERELEPDMLLITDGVKPVGLAGVMGGANSEVTEATRNILLESARFLGSSIRRTSRRLGLRSEASLRFEKEVNPDGIVPALNRAAALMARYAGGKVAAGIAERKVREPEPVRVSISRTQVNAFLGTSIAQEEMEGILARLRFPFESSGEICVVDVPPRRGDISRDVDLIEEIARLYGYDNIPATPVTGATTPGSLTKAQRIRRRIREVLTGAGLHETINYAFTHPDHIRQYPGLFPDAKPIRLAMPMSEERSVLRTSLIPPLLDTAQYNRHRRQDDIAIFELANVYISREETPTRLPEEHPLLAVLWTGRRGADSWSEKAPAVDFYDLKGLADRLFRHLGLRHVTYHPARCEGMHPGRTAEIRITANGRETVIGRIGQLHPEVQQARDLKDTYVMEIALEPVYAAADFAVVYTPVPKVPAVTRDIAVVVDAGVPAAALLDAVKDAGGALLESVELFDVYTGEHIGAGKKSVALSLTYRDPERTLTDEEVAALHERVAEALTSQFAAQLRQ